MSDNISQHEQLEWVDEMPIELFREVVEWMELQMPSSNGNQGDSGQERAISRLAAEGLLQASTNEHSLVNEHSPAPGLDPLQELAPEHYSSCLTLNSNITLECDHYSSCAPNGCSGYLGICTGNFAGYYFQDVAPQLPLETTALAGYHDVIALGEIQTLEQSNEEVSGEAHSSAVLLPSAAPPLSREHASPAEHDEKRSRSRADTLNCHYEGCSHEKSFRRQYELDRHISVKHKAEKPFWCTSLGCFKGQSAPAFARADKLTAHIRTVHGRDRTAVFGCPDQECDVQAMSLDLLGIHLQKQHSWKRKDLLHLRAIKNAATTERTSCPLWSCSEIPLLNQLISHLMEHSQHDLEGIEQDLLIRNYALSRDSSLGTLDDTRLTEPNLAGLLPISGIKVLCPMCKCPCDDHPSFKYHFDTTHAIATPQRLHYWAWQNYLREHVSRLGKHAAQQPPWLKDFSRYRTREAVLRCPECEYFISSGAEQNNSQGAIVSLMDSYHQQAMLTDPAEIKPYRRAILRLYPDFATHPVWDDMK